jgi:uncharacterized protein
MLLWTLLAANRARRGWRRRSHGDGLGWWIAGDMVSRVFSGGRGGGFGGYDSSDSFGGFGGGDSGGGGASSDW